MGGVVSEGWVGGEGRDPDGAGLALDVPVGYRRTEVGVIPENWEARSLRSTLAESPSYGINAPAVPFDGSLPTYIRITDIGSDGRFRPTPRVSVNGAHATSFFLKPGDLVFARTGASVGKSYLYDRRDGPLVFAGFLIRLTPDPRRLRPAFIAYYVQTRRYWRWIANNSARSGQPGINSREYGSLPIPVPPVAEQQAIAAVLSDVDELLGSLEALIAKKRDIKQAAMQELLTGRTRLPGFGGEWEVVELNAFVRIRDRKISPVEVRGDTPCVELEHIGQGDGRLTSHGRAERTSSIKHRFEPRDVLFGRLRPYLRKWWYADRAGVCSTEIWPLVVDQGRAESGFVYALVQTGRFLDAAEASYGTHMPRADWNIVSGVEFPLPPLPEQQAIATVLSDMDAEIAALEHRLDKTHAIKQGMMQQLLTGTIRLPIPNDDTEDDHAHDV